MRILQSILLVAMLIGSALCQAEESCLWLNAATAGGVLGGVVTTTISRPNGAPPIAYTANSKSSAGPMSANPSGVSYSNNGMDDADCVFARLQGSTRSEMRIEVRTMREPRKEFTSYATRCGVHASPLKAIGNEALSCSSGGKAGHFSEQVVGRVRDRAFLIRLTTNDSALGQDLPEKTRKTAEQVAGNLF